MRCAGLGHTCAQLGLPPRRCVLVQAGPERPNQVIRESKNAKPSVSLQQLLQVHNAGQVR